MNATIYTNYERLRQGKQHICLTWKDERGQVYSKYFSVLSIAEGYKTRVLFNTF